MIITHFGKQFFKIQFGDVVLAFNPISKDAKGGAPTKFGSTVAFSKIYWAESWPQPKWIGSYFFEGNESIIIV